MAGLDAETLHHALATAQERGFKVVKLKGDGMQFRAVLGAASEEEHEEVSEFAPEGAGETAATEFLITAPVVGYFNTGKVAIKKGQKISAGDVVGQIQALGLANDVHSPQAGTIAEVLVSNGQAVMYGQPIAKGTVTE